MEERTIQRDINVRVQDLAWDCQTAILMIRIAWAIKGGMPPLLTHDATDYRE